jgi:hypothetical protein
MTADGAPLFAYADRSPIVQPPPVPVPRPIGAYIGLGVLGIAGVTALGFVAAILAIALSVGAVSLTICVVVLRGVWRQAQADGKG